MELLVVLVALAFIPTLIVVVGVISININLKRVEEHLRVMRIAYEASGALTEMRSTRQ